MRKLLALVAILSLGMAGNVWAFHCPEVSSSSTTYRCTMTVFNDNGSAITSGHTVAWDSDDTDFSTTGSPYIIATATADDPYTAGVMLTPSCADQSLCEIVVRGMATVVVADSTDNAAVDTLVGVSTVSGQVGDYATGANTCSVGNLVAFNASDAVDNALGRVFVDIDCD